MKKVAFYACLILMIAFGWSACQTIKISPEQDFTQPTPILEATTLTTKPTPVELQPDITGSSPVEIAAPATPEPPASSLSSTPLILTAAPILADTYIFPTGTFTATPDNATAELVDACKLILPDDVFFIFPILPIPTYNAIDNGSYKGSSCIFQGNDLVLTVSVAMDFGSIIEISQDVENITKMPGSISFSTSGADIYLVDNLVDDSGLKGFGGIILRDDISVEIIGSGNQYQSNLENETDLLNTLASRLPPYSRIIDRINACSLVQADEVGALFPNPPRPQNAFKFGVNNLISVCTYENEKMTLIFNLGFVTEENRQGLANTQELTLTLIPEAELYLAGFPNDVPGAGDDLFGAIVKNGILLSIQGHGSQYHYDPEREKQLLINIAASLP